MARQDLALYESVQSSNLPYETKSALRRWFDAAVTMPEVVRPTKKQIHGTLSSFRVGAEAFMTGFALGVINVESPGGLEPAGVPLDAVASGLFLAGAAIGAESDMAPTARNIGAVTSASFGKRMAEKFCVERRLSKGEAIPKHLQYSAARMSGETPQRIDVSKDPIVQAAEAFAAE